MQCLEVSGAVRLIYRSLGVKGLTSDASRSVRLAGSGPRSGSRQPARVACSAPGRTATSPAVVCSGQSYNRRHCGFRRWRRNVAVNTYSQIRLFVRPGGSFPKRKVLRSCVTWYSLPYPVVTRIAIVRVMKLYN